MSRATPVERGTAHLRSLERYVRDPIRRAERRAVRERDEIAAERAAFRAFAARIADLPPASTGRQPTAERTLVDESRPDHTDAIRTAYRETVLSVDHYDRVYGESLSANVTAEFGPDLAAVVDGSGTTVPPPQRRALRGQALVLAHERAQFCETLAGESESLRTLCEDLGAAIGELDSSVIPAWYREEWDERLEALVHRRHELLIDRSSSIASETDLCTYLYDGDDWTYPGLTAIARLCESVTAAE